jgi:tetratricopeptide (TPR) repeat protein
VGTSLNNLDELYRTQGQYTAAEPLYMRALAIHEKAFGSRHPDVATCLQNYAALLWQTNREAEAAEMGARARAIRVMRR